MTTENSLMTAFNPDAYLPSDGPSLDDALAIEPLQLQDEFVKLPSSMGYWNMQYARALHAHGVLKVELSKMEAERDTYWRETLGDDPSVGRVTEKMVESAIKSDPLYLEAKQRLLDAEAARALIAGYCEAMRAKKDMLIQMGAHIRAEMERDPSIREEQRSGQFYNDR